MSRNILHTLDCKKESQRVRGKQAKQAEAGRDGPAEESHGDVTDLLAKWNKAASLFLGYRSRKPCVVLKIIEIAI